MARHTTAGKAAKKAALAASMPEAELRKREQKTKKKLRFDAASLLASRLYPGWLFFPFLPRPQGSEWGNGVFILSFAKNRSSPFLPSFLPRPQAKQCGDSSYQKPK